MRWFISHKAIIGYQSHEGDLCLLEEAVNMNKIISAGQFCTAIIIALDTPYIYRVFADFADGVGLISMIAAIGGMSARQQTTPHQAPEKIPRVVRFPVRFISVLIQNYRSFRHAPVL